MLSEGLRERLRSYRAERLGRILADDGIVPLLAGPRLVLQLVPLGSLAEPRSYPVSMFKENRRSELACICNRNGSLGGAYNLDCLCDVWALQSDGSKASAYVQLFQSGIIEAVDAHIVRPMQGGDSRYDKTLATGYVVPHMIAAVERYLIILRDLLVEAPVYLMVTMDGLMGYRLVRSQCDCWPGVCVRNQLAMDLVVIEDLSVGAATVLRPVFDGLWRSFGLKECSLYGEDGVYRGSER